MLEQKWKEIIENHPDAHRRSGIAQLEELNHSSFCRAGETLEALYLPKAFSIETKHVFEQIVETTYGILTKMIRHYIGSADFRARFGFPKEIEELICIPNLYDSVLPVARFDIFYHEEDGSFGFCEINTDGSGAMNRQVVLNQSLQPQLLYQKEIAGKYEVERIDPIENCMNALLDIYETYEKKKVCPNIAVVDFVYDGSSYAEWLEFARRFRARGHEAQVCDIRALRYRNGVLYAPDGMPIDLIYRRAVTTDIIDHFNEVQDFISAVRDQNVCVMGSLCTQVVHHKILFKLLHEPEVQELLTPEEQAFVKEHVPYTASLSPDTRTAYMQKDRWILKPEDGYCCSGVIVGPDVTQAEWEKALIECAGQPYIIQEMYPYERTPNIDYGRAADETPVFRDYVNMSGLYVFGGRLGGVFSRQSAGNAIISEVNERSVPTVFLKEKRL